MTQVTRYCRFTIAMLATLLAGAMLADAARAAEQSKPPTVRPNSISLEPDAPEQKPLPTQLLPPIEPGQSSAARWLQLIDQATLGESWQEPVECRKQAARDRRGLCRLQWRKRSGLSALRGRYDEYSYEMTRRFAGKHLADHLEFDIDRSPEIRLHYDIK